MKTRTRMPGSRTMAGRTRKTRMTKRRPERRRIARGRRQSASWTRRTVTTLTSTCARQQPQPTHGPPHSAHSVLLPTYVKNDIKCRALVDSGAELTPSPNSSDCLEAHASERSALHTPPPQEGDEEERPRAAPGPAARLRPPLVPSLRPSH